MKAYDCEEFKDPLFSVPMGLSGLLKFSVRQAILGLGPHVLKDLLRVSS